MEKITVTRGLVQLKLQDKKIRKKIRGACFATIEVGGKVKEESCDPEADYQSIRDLINRRDKIKAAIMKSNSETIVEVAGEKMTVADAIERKNSIQYYKQLLDQMRAQYASINDEIERINEDVRYRLDKMLEANFGKDGKIREEDLKKIEGPFLEANQAKIMDPLKLEEQIKQLGDWIDEFESEVDLVLSESNTRTLIEV